MFIKEDTYLNSVETRNYIEEVLDCAKESVISTMGPDGSVSCIIEINEPIMTKDGVRVAKALDFDNPQKNAIAKLITTAAIRTDDIVGDGTTTTLLMIYELYHQLKSYNTWNDIKKVDELINRTKEILLSKVSLITPEDKIFENMLLTTSNYQEDITKVVLDIYKKYKNPNIILNKGYNYQEDTALHNGSIKIDGSYMHGSLAPKVKEGKIDITNSSIIIVDNNIPSFKSETEKRIIELAIKTGPLIIVARDFDELVISKLRSLNSSINDSLNTDNVIYIIPYRLNAGGTLGSEYVQDLASLVNKNVYIHIDEFLGHDIETAHHEETITLTNTGIEFSTEEPIIKERADKILSHAEMLYNDMSVNERAGIFGIHLLNRISRLRASNIYLYVSGKTSPEIDERYYLYEDVVKAAKSGLLYGVIPGIGYGYVEAAKEIVDEYGVNDSLVNIFTDVLCSQYNYLMNTNLSVNRGDEFRYLDIITNKTHDIPENVFDNGAAAISAIEGAWSVVKRLFKMKTILGGSNKKYGMN